MKPIFILLIVFASLAGCGKNEDDAHKGYFDERATPASDVERSRNKYRLTMRTAVRCLTQA